ncbi:MAG TPA: hypothetical protein VNL70_00280 [Tepidisphaeraceae bacterium]|nr:hypothetical protein [Tepidisphaeraceae bacterium]
MQALIIISLLIAIVVIAAIIGRYTHRKRQQQMSELASSLGFAFDPEPLDVQARYVGFWPMDVGRSHSSFNLISGVTDRPTSIQWEIFDHRYTTGSGKNRRTHHMTIVAATVGQFSFPRLTMRPEGIFDKLAAMVGYDDIDFPSDEFSSRYHVKCEDRRFAYDLLTPRVIEYLLASPPRHWQLAGPRIVLVSSGRASADDIRQAMSLIEGFIQRIPQHVAARVR